VLLEIFNNLFRSLAEEMGAVLQNTASSVNIKERLDFSCALFDAQGGLVANAPHIPVHLGSMSESVRAVIIRMRGGEKAEGGMCSGEMKPLIGLAQSSTGIRPGDVFVLNNPYEGGTHLPDITVITPVFDESGDEILFFTASRGHHADVGGITPGSMPPDSTHIDQEGVLIDVEYLIREGEFRERRILELFTSGPYPARDPSRNIADLKAQAAANQRGAEQLRRLIGQYGLNVVRAYMKHIQSNAAACVHRALHRLRDGEHVCLMDNGARVQVKLHVDARTQRAVIDFTGTSPQSGDNFNAPVAVVNAAVLYVFRSIVDEDIPLNSGCLEPLEIVLPPGSLLNPRYPAAVAAGNVETSQIVVDALYGAMGILAASQGTMNNLTFGKGDYQYYETICGGTGAGADFDGTDAVHSHMTNSRLTDPEVLESRYPVMVEEFAIRRGSGGKGAHRGGRGAIRRLRFRDNVAAAILSGRRRVPPHGLLGGESGRPGRNYLVRGSSSFVGTMEELDSCDRADLNAGDVLVIETPGGGGFGRKTDGL